MARDGSGVFSLDPTYDVSAGDTIQPEQLKKPLEDIEATLNTARPVSVGGTGAATAAAARANLGAQPTTRALDTTGSSNAYVLSTPEGLASLTNGDVVLFVANHSNTGAATLNVDSLGAKDLQKTVDGTPTALASGDIDSGGHYLATYDASVGTGAWIVHAIPRVFLDEDDMASNSATAVASQQSIKAYADSVAPTHLRKTADQTVNNSTTLVNDTHLKYALAANEAVKFQLVLWVAGNNTAKFKSEFTLPTGGTMSWAFTQPGSGDGVAMPRVTAGLSGLLTTVDLHVDQDSFIVIDGWVDNGSNAGDLQFRWAQGTADASDTTVKTGSTMSVWTF